MMCQKINEMWEEINNIMQNQEILNIEGLKVSINDKPILKGVNLSMNKGEIHVIMGQNGSGKSTLAAAIAGNPIYEIDAGKMEFYGENLLEMEVYERARAGIFLSFQHPQEIPGLEIEHFLRMAKENMTGKKVPVAKFHRELLKVMEELEMPEDYATRSLNEGFSGGEKKKSEILQMAVIQPKFVILDETDSGLDIDAIKTVFQNIKKILNKNPDMNAVIITHYNKVLEYLEPEKVHVMHEGRIVKSGGMEIVGEIEKIGYDQYVSELEG